MPGRVLVAGLAYSKLAHIDQGARSKTGARQNRQAENTGLLRSRCFATALLPFLTRLPKSVYP